MRDLRFRAWHEGYPEKGIGAAMYYEDEPGDALVWLKNGQPVVVEQFTGQRDLNGIGIWEGDIVQVDSLSHGLYLSVVKYREDKVGFVVDGGYRGNKQLQMPQKEWDREYDPCNCDGAMFEGWRVLSVGVAYPTPHAPVEVVGNIHENPELLQ